MSILAFKKVFSNQVEDFRVTEIKQTRRKRTAKQPDKELTLDDLIANITPENRHAAIDWGPPVGKEIW